MVAWTSARSSHPPSPVTGTPGLPPELAPPALPDPGSPFLARFALLATILCLAATFVLQQRLPPPSPTPPPSPPASSPRRPTTWSASFVLKVMLKIGHLGTTQGPASPRPPARPRPRSSSWRTSTPPLRPRRALRSPSSSPSCPGGPAASERSEP